MKKNKIFWTGIFRSRREGEDPPPAPGPALHTLNGHAQSQPGNRVTDQFR